MAGVDPGRVAVLHSGESPIRAAEVVGALSLATDLGTGQPRMVSGREHFFDLGNWDEFWS